MCRLLGASPSGYYAWSKRPPCPRAQEDARLRELILAIHARSRGTYGVPRIRAELRFDHDVRCSGKRVRRLMLQIGIQGKRRRWRARTTWRILGVAPAPDLVQRNFSASAPDQVYVADIKYIWTREDFLYLAGVIDVFTRAPVGWAMATPSTPTSSSTRSRWRSGAGALRPASSTTQIRAPSTQAWPSVELSARRGS